MNFKVNISDTETTSHESAAVWLSDSNGNNTPLYFDYSKLLSSVRKPTERAQDFLLVATTVYALDKLVSRSRASDGWTRIFDVTVPVSDHSIWSGISENINECLSFLSGDEWNVKFENRVSPLIRRRRRKRRSRVKNRFASGKAACLFSGGLDSLIGAIDWLEANPNESLSLVGHHDPGIGGPLSDQTSLLAGLSSSYSSRLYSTFVGLGHSGAASEITMRSRSLLFVALGIVVAEELGDGTTLLIPENGTITLNVPLTPSRRGSCSTRTTHPYYISLLQKWLVGIGLNHPLENPLIGKSKGIAVLECRNAGLLKSIYQKSVSCAKRGHKSTWLNKQANGCGRCMPCIYRRAALHAANLDDEIYGVDVCRGEVDWNNPHSEAADDFRACLSFILNNPPQMQIAKMLLASGYLHPLESIRHAATVEYAMNEIRQLLKDKGSESVRNAARLNGWIGCAN